MYRYALSTGLVLALTAFGAGAKQLVDMRSVNKRGVGQSIGSVELSETKYGVVLTPRLHDLPPGLHGFHVHEKPSCEPAMKGRRRVAAQAAGEHYDPGRTRRHDTPWGRGHRGDLPALYVDEDGTAAQPVLAPRLKLAELRGRSLMVHVGADNHADHPEPSGGGGARIACGVIR